MHFSRKRFFVSTTILLMSLLILRTISAQSDECVALVLGQLDNMQNKCSQMDSSEACLGLSTDSGEVDTVNTVSLTDITSFSTLPLDLEAGTIGWAMMHVPADVPRALSEDGLVYFLMGEAYIENRVPLESAHTPADPVMIAPIVGANLRSIPSTDGRVVGSASVGTEMSADGLSADQGWLRIYYEGMTAWISRQVISVQEGDVESLPVMGNDTQTLMQDFILHTGPDSSECEGVPSALMIQSPADANAEITVNGVDITFSGTIALKVTEDNRLQLFTVRGGANSDSISVPPGFTMTVALSEDGESTDGFWTGLRPINDDERTLLLPLQSIPENVLHETVSVPSQAEVTQLMSVLNQSNAGQARSGPAAGSAECDGFRPTSPLDGFAYGTTPFYWDGASGATRYRLNIYDEGGSLVYSTEIDGFNTTISVDTGGGLPFSNSYQWDVDALVDGQIACTSGRVNVLRESPPSAPASSGGGGGGSSDSEPTPCKWDSC